LASLQPMRARGATRGPAEIYRKLFARPFGPRAVASYVAEARSEAPQVYGVSREDAERMDLLLDQIKSAEHGQRMLSGYIFLGLGALYGVLGGSALYFGERLGDTKPSKDAYSMGAIFLGAGTLSIAFGGYTLAAPWSGERAALDYHAALGSGTDYARAFAAAEARLRDVSAREARERWLLRGVASTVLLGSAAAITYNELTATTPRERFNGRAFGGVGAMVGGTMLAFSYLIESPVERLTTVWQRDPGMLHVQPAITPTQSGISLGLTGQF
jgi:hypothetical protein